MDIHAERQNGILIARAEGHRIDSSNARDFQSSLEGAIQEEDVGMVLDFRNVTYISSAGMRVILYVVKILQKKGAKFAICGMHEPVREVFSISGFDKIVQIRDSQAEAIAVCS